jgi:Fe2+ transport system protein A
MNRVVALQMFSDVLSYCRDCYQRMFSGRNDDAAESSCLAGNLETLCAVSNQNCKTLAEVPEGSSWKVRCLTSQGAVRQRLLDIGFMPGARITMIRSAPLGDPIEIGIGSGYIALRRSEAEGVRVIEA